jgi:hypothetical protein
MNSGHQLLRVSQPTAEQAAIDGMVVCAMVSARLDHTRMPASVTMKAGTCARVNEALDGTDQ